MATGLHKIYCQVRQNLRIVMPRPKGPKRDASGRFRPTITAACPPNDESNDSDSNFDMLLDSDCAHDADTEGSDYEDDSDDEWNAIGKVLPHDERWKERKVVPLAEIKRIEYQLDGPVDKQGGAKDKTGKKRGPYNVGGMSDRNAHRKRAKIRDEYGKVQDLDEDTLKERNQKLETIKACPSTPAHAKITDFFQGKNNHTPNHDSDDDVQVISHSSTSLGTQEFRADMDAPLLDNIMEDEESSKGEGITPPPEAEELVCQAEQITDWVEGVLNEDAPKTSAELEALA